MSDLSSSSKITANNVGPSVSNLEIASKTANKTNNPQLNKQQNPINTANTEGQIKSPSPKDSFKSSNANVSNNINLSDKQLPKTSANKSQNPQQAAAAGNNVQNGSLNQINHFMSRFVNIMDKISAVFGEKEKDLKDRLSDTFKRQEVKEYNPLEKVDTAMEQKDHHKEKKIRNADEDYLNEDESIPHIFKID